ncbi:gamma-glutamylcyclotransferase family protein [Yoonia litorea]|uniref:ChaC-like protein n=1 Tax=Yoonia litorea TaxID=1123755 RepID=A0A1I6N167_9RHOB|nr:gamma-glutamylcyclotransferase family protein [Yoonia litorea]SFS21654.1 ChaC-like protein [Yoonia litorea]
MSHPSFFGYGSLVNLATHSYADPRTATLRGWRRVWRGTALREVSYLSVIPDGATTLKGVIAGVPNDDWAALDQREAAYARHDVSHLVDHIGQTAVYQVKPEHVSSAGTHPILLSYVDVVAQGYLRLYGEDGVGHFFDTTDGWGVPLLNDRADPIYPRHQALTSYETDLVTAHLERIRNAAL